MKVRELLTVWTFETDQNKVDKFGSSIEGLKSAAATVGVALAAAAVAVGTAVTAMVLDTVKAADHIDELAQQAGITTDALQELAFAGSFSSLSMDDMVQSMGFLQKAMLAAKGGSKELKKVFRTLRVDTRNADGSLRSTDEVLGDVAEAFHKGLVPDTEKAAVAMKIFGRAGKQMIPVLNTGREGLARMRAEAPKMSEEMIKQGARIDDQFVRIGGAWKKIKFSVAERLFPVLEKIADATLEWVEAHKELIAAGITAAWDALSTAAVALYDAIVFLVDGVKQFIEEFKKGEGPIFNIVAAINPLVFLLQLLWASWDRVKAVMVQVWSVISRLLEPVFRLLAPLLDLIREHWDAITKVMKYAMLTVLIPIAAVIASVVAAFAAMGAAILLVISAVADLINWIRGADSVIGDFFGRVGEGLRGAWGSIIDWISSKIDWVVGKLNDAIDLVNKLPGVNIGNRSLASAIASIPGAVPAGGATPRAETPNPIAMAIGDVTVNVGGTNASAQDVGVAVQDHVQAAISKMLRRAQSDVGR